MNGSQLASDIKKLTIKPQHQIDWRENRLSSHETYTLKNVYFQILHGLHWESLLSFISNIHRHHYETKMIDGWCRWNNDFFSSFSFWWLNFRHTDWFAFVFGGISVLSLQQIEIVTMSYDSSTSDKMCACTCPMPYGVSVFFRLYTQRLDCQHNWIFFFFGI